MLVLFDAVIFIYGVYTVYSAVNMKRTGKLSSWFTGGTAVSAIRDEQGYIDYIYGKTIVMGAMASLFGLAGFVNDRIIPVPDVMRAMILLFLTVCIWFYISINRAKRRFW